MIKRLLKSIRQKPKHSRDNIAFSLAALFSGLIFVVWLYNAPVRHTVIEERYVNTEESDSTSSFSSFFSNFRDQMASIKDSVKIEEQLADEEVIIGDDGPIQIDQMTVEGRASTSDKYTWPTEDEKSVESTSTQSSIQPPAETGREVRIITTEKSTTTANQE